MLLDMPRRSSRYERAPSLECPWSLMWPWEHAAVGYLLYSLWCRMVYREPPSDLPVAAVVIGSQLPDLIDKPLSWGLGVFQTGYALGHSALVTVPVGLAVGIGSIRTAHHRTVTALLIGYWSHLVGDVVNPLRSGGTVRFDTVLWPVVVGPPYEQDLGLARGLVYVTDLFDSLQTADSLSLVGAYLLVPGITIVVWIADGMPGMTVFNWISDRFGLE